MYCRRPGGALDARPGPGPGCPVPARGRSGSSSTPSTSGGTPSWRSRSPAPAARAGSPPIRSATSTCPSPPIPCCPAATWATASIDFAAISRAVTAAGYDGVVEVEIFNADIWASDPDEVVATVKDRWAALVAPSLRAPPRFPEPLFLIPGAVKTTGKPHRCALVVRYFLGRVHKRWVAGASERYRQLRPVQVSPGPPPHAWSDVGPEHARVETDLARGRRRRRTTLDRWRAGGSPTWASAQSSRSARPV